MSRINEKITTELADKLVPGERIDVIIQLDYDSEAAGASGAAEAFSKEAQEVINEIKELDGAVTGTVWLNKTIKAKVLAESLDTLSLCDTVSRIDLPRKLFT